jgi:phospholipase/lecithinase/hemolysin
MILNKDQYLKEIKEDESQNKKSFPDSINSVEKEEEKKDQEEKNANVFGDVIEELNKKQVVNEQRNKRMKDKFEKGFQQNSVYLEATPTWIYFTINEETYLNKIGQHQQKLLKEIKSKFFKNMKETDSFNPAILFKRLKEDYNWILTLYNDDDVCRIYNNRGSYVYKN